VSLPVTLLRPQLGYHSLRRSLNPPKCYTDPLPATTSQQKLKAMHNVHSAHSDTIYPHPYNLRRYSKDVFGTLKWHSWEALCPYTVFSQNPSDSQRRRYYPRLHVLLILSNAFSIRLQMPSTLFCRRHSPKQRLSVFSMRTHLLQPKPISWCQVRHTILNTAFISSLLL
jgi:hypothetical protein